MGAVTFTTVSCDRCRAEATFAQGHERTHWGIIGANQVGGRAQIGGGPVSADDLCPACFDELIGWFTGAAAPLEQPPPPPPPTRPLFSLKDRTRAVELTETVLADQVAAAISVLREAPTAILSGDMVPGALAGVGDRAAAIVDGIIDQLGIRGARRERQPDAAA